MTNQSLPTPATLRKAFRYNPQTGFLYWRKGHHFAGKCAGSVDPGHGYRRVKLNGRLHLAHRIILAMVNNAWPEHEVDHINRIRDDNRLCNLRCVDRCQNMQNRPLYKSNKSGVAGVYWHDQHQKWCADICANGKRMFIGLFVCIGAAACARHIELNNHNFHHNHGRKS